MRSSSPMLLVVGCSFLVMGSCADDTHDETIQTQRALWNGKAHSIIVPAYFQKDPSSVGDWQRLEYWGCGGDDDPAPVAYAIANAGRDWGGTDTGHPRNQGGLVLGGPGDSNNPSAANAYVQERINSFRDNGCSFSFGYVDFYFQRSTTEIEDDINHWLSDYAVQGIFFDDAGRDNGSNQGGIGRARYYANYVRQHFAQAGRTGMVMFNYGGISNYLEGFVYCTRSDAPTTPFTYYVTAETDEYHYFHDDAGSNFVATYNTPSLQAWLYQYWPGRFLHIVHHETASEVNLASIMTTSAARNAQQVYITDLPNPNDPADPANPYKYLNGHNSTPQFKLFDDQAYQSTLPQNYPYTGSNFWYDESPNVWGTCPNPTSTEGGVGT
jgi:hypothetical protein